MYAILTQILTQIYRSWLRECDYHKIQQYFDQNSENCYYIMISFFFRAHLKCIEASYCPFSFQNDYQDKIGMGDNTWKSYLSAHLFHGITTKHFYTIWKQAKQNICSISPPIQAIVSSIPFKIFCACTYMYTNCYILSEL